MVDAFSWSTHWMLDCHDVTEPSDLMATPTEENFQDYKKAEKKALAIVAEMKSASAKKNDIELALLVAIFELHKGTLPPETIGGIVQGHLKQIIPFYGPQAQPTG
jgi:hypothetical protein|tara:strand:+ start:2423 stop:2737 length:315 start_codon:yes stop_codon:yes gene_type:complete